MRHVDIPAATMIAMKVRELVAHGFCPRKDSDGESVCIYTAIWMVAGDERHDAVYRMFRDHLGHDPMLWYDKPGRTHQQVIEACDGFVQHTLDKAL